MKFRVTVLIAALSITALLAGGCAKKELVKTEEPGTATTQPDASKSPVQQPYFKGEDPGAAGQKQPEGPADIKPADAQAGKTAAEVSVFETVYFDYDKSDLRPETRAALSKNAETMLKNKTSLKIRIEGHCDERGSAEYNLALGERRANSVQQYLTTLGVQPDRLSVISYGKEKPAVQGSGEEVWAKNRRAEFKIAK